MAPINPLLILPVGTQVVTRGEIAGSRHWPARPKGSVGIVVEAPRDNEHAYRVRFPDGGVVSLMRQELSIRKAHQAEGLQAENHVLAEYDLHRHIVYVCVVGSRAYGLAEKDSDYDRRGIYLPPADLHWSLYGLPEQLEDAETEECYWELQKFLTLALKANPNILECLYTPLVEKATPLIEELLGMRERFLSRLIYQTYNGYVLSQFKRMEQDMRVHGNVKLKHAMHLIRLLLAGITALREGYVPVDVGPHRDSLLSIRRGEMPWEEVNRWRLDLHKEFDSTYQTTTLPDRPDYEAANAFLIRARRSVV